MSDTLPRNRRVSERLRCCICGGDTTDATDYILLELTTETNEAQQWLGAHAAHLNQAMAPGFRTEIHLM